MPEKACLLVYRHVRVRVCVWGGGQVGMQTSMLTCPHTPNSTRHPPTHLCIQSLYYKHSVHFSPHLSLAGEGKLELEGVRPLRRGDGAAAGGLAGSAGDAALLLGECEGAVCL